MFRSLNGLVPVAALVVLAACGRDVTAPDAARSLAPGSATALLGVNESVRYMTDSSDAAGNHIMVAEYPAGIYTLPNGDAAFVASVTIRTFISGAPASSKTCVTSTIVGIETTAGWTSNVKKSGGCNQEIGVQFENRSTKQRADFSFLMVPGKTRLDFGAVR